LCVRSGAMSDFGQLEMLAATGKGKTMGRRFYKQIEPDDIDELYNWQQEVQQEVEEYEEEYELPDVEEFTPRVTRINGELVDFHDDDMDDEYDCYFDHWKP
jgi:NifB/MoaA-like Fe-S oxidoreductase